MAPLMDLLTKNRSYRRFDQQSVIPFTEIAGWVANVRLTPSAGNLQPLRFMIVNDPEQNGLIFDQLKWAMYLNDWAGPEEGERPAAYIVILAESHPGNFIYIDAGIALQTILLGAAENGYGGCTIASCNRERIRAILGITDRLDILLVVALGKPREKVVVEEMREDDVHYWRDDSGVHHVPKRKLEDMLYRPVSDDADPALR